MLANAGSYSADGTTYGLCWNKYWRYYVNGWLWNGSYDIDTERLDLGTGTTTITGESEADIDYYHIAAAAKLTKR